MFDQLKNMAGDLLGGGTDPQAVAQAASDHVNDMDPSTLQDHLNTAAQNLSQSGQGDVAQQVMGIISQVQTNPAGAKDAVVSLLQNNPELLQHFAPGFAQGILGKLGV